MIDLYSAQLVLAAGVECIWSDHIPEFAEMLVNKEPIYLDV